MIRTVSHHVIVIAMGLVIGLVGCQARGVQTMQGQPCSVIEGGLNLSDRIDALNRLADAFVGWCCETVIVHGERARSEFRHKTFSLLKEAGNVFVPEGSFIDYVLESYERGILAFCWRRVTRTCRSRRRRRWSSGSWITSSLRRSTITAKTR